MNKDNKTNYIDDDYLIFDHKDIAKFINKNKHNIEDIKNNIGGFDIKNSINDLDEAISENKNNIDNINKIMNSMYFDINENKNNMDFHKINIDKNKDNINELKRLAKVKEHNYNDRFKSLEQGYNRLKKQCNNSELHVLINYCFGGLGFMFLINIITWIVILTK